MLFLLIFSTVFSVGYCQTSIITVVEKDELAVLKSDIAKNIATVEVSTSQTIVLKTIEFTRSESMALNKTMCNQLTAEPYSAVLDLTWGGWIRGRQNADMIGLPYYRVDITNHPYVMAVAALFNQSQVVDSVFVFESKQELDMCMYYIIMYSELRITGAWLAGDKASLNKLRDMKPRPSNIVVIGSKTAVSDILAALDVRELIKRDSFYSLIYTDLSTPASVTEDISQYFQSNMSVRLFTPQQSTCCQLIGSSGPDCVCDKTIPRLFLNAALEVVGKATKVLNSVQTINQKWVCGSNTSIPTRTKLNTEIATQAKERGLYFGLDATNVPLLSPSFKLDVTLFTPQSKQLLTIGNWYMGGGYNTSTTYKEVVMKRSFRIGVVLGKPWAWVSGAKEDKQTNPKSINNALKNKGLEGYTLDLLDEVSKAMHFDYEIVIATGNDYGARDPVTSQWSGLMGDLISGNIDISLASLIMTTEREEYVDFVTPYFDQSGISILLREKYVERNMFKFFLVLQDEVWLGILGCVLVVILILWILDRFSPYSYVNNREAYPEGAREFTFGECIWFCLTSLTPQGGGECPKALSARVLVAAYWLFIVLMLATFTSNLAALLTVERMQTTVQSLEDLARQSQVNYTVLEGSPTMEYFKNMAGAEEELYRKWKELTLNSSAESNKFRVWDYPIREQYTHIWDVIKSGNPVKSPEEGYNRVKESQKGLFAFISDASEIKYQYYTNCEFLEIGEPFAEQPLAIAVQEGSSLSKELSQVVLGLQKDRFFEKVHSKFWNIGQRQACPVMNDNQGITLESLGGIFLTTLVGLALSVLMLIYEIYQEKKEEQIAKIQPMLFKNRQDEKMYGDLDKPTYTLSGDMTRSSRKLADVD